MPGVRWFRPRPFPRVQLLLGRWLAPHRDGTRHHGHRAELGALAGRARGHLRRRRQRTRGRCGLRADAGRGGRGPDGADSVKRFVSLNGQTMTVKEASQALGIHPCAIARDVHRGRFTSHQNAVDAIVKGLPSKQKMFAGDRYGRLVMIKRVAVLRPGRAQIWLAVCDCGTSIEVRAESVRNCSTKSCGCLQKELVAVRARKHGQGAHGRRTAEYKTWLRIKSRCASPNDSDYRKYGARGIAVCERWASSFEAFLADMGQRPSSKHSIDRINGSGNYEPGNCRWATSDVQALNTTWVRFVTLEGERVSCAEAERRLGIGRSRISPFATRRGISHQEAMDLLRQKKERKNVQA